MNFFILFDHFTNTFFLQGSLGFERHIDHLMSLSAFFKDEIEKKKHFELVTQPCFINVCFWFIPLHLRDKDSICNYEEELSKVSINYFIMEF